FTVNRNAAAKTLDVLANDTLDPAIGGTLSITNIGTTDHGGTVSITQNGARVSYAPATGFQGVEHFTYTIGDGHGNSTSGTVTVTVNGPPTANGDGTGTSNALTVFQGTNT